MRIRVFIDINETLIKTGESDKAFQLAEIQNLWTFRDQVIQLASTATALEIVLLTGNSFEYSRRVEEPLGLKNIDGVEVSIVSENGLIARSFNRGELWQLGVSPQYRQAVELFRETIRSQLSGEVYFQGNESRLTLKPTADTFPAETKDAIQQLIANSDLGPIARVYVHDYYVDVDPSVVLNDSDEVEFSGKGWAVDHLRALQPASRCYAFGDSLSDIPMYESVVGNGGRGFHVANGVELPAKFQNVENIVQLENEFTAGVIEGFESIMRELPTG